MSIMNKLILTKDETSCTFDQNTWQRKIYNEFDAALASTSRAFPCVYGVSGHNTGQLRFIFQDRLDAAILAEGLASFLRDARTFGPLTSLVVFEAPNHIDTIEAYHQRFWSLLRDISELDAKPWPSEISPDVMNETWEFCFAGEPIFVVCNTPAHVARQSRRSSAMMLTFQPRWVFDNILGNRASASKATGTVRARLQSYDFVKPSSALGLYGDHENREALQYFLSDDETSLQCPYTNLRRQ